MLNIGEGYRDEQRQGLLDGLLFLFLRKVIGRSSSVAIFLFCLLFFIGTFGQASGQTTRIYVSSSLSQTCDSSNLLTCPFVEIKNPENAAGNNLLSFAEIKFPSLAGSRYLELRFDNSIPAGTTIRIKVVFAPVLASLLNNIQIRAYRGTIAVSPQYPASGLLSVLGGNNVQEIVLTPAITGPDFNRIRINFSSLLSVGGYFRVNAAYYLTTAGLVNCGGVKDVIYGSTATLIGGFNSVIDPSNAIDGNANTFTRLNSNVSVADKTHVTALFDDLSRVGDSIRIILRNPAGGLLDANLISQNLAITSYNDRSAAETLALDASFLRLTLLGGAGNKYELTYPALIPFNRVEVSLDQGLVSALNSLEVYEISRTLVSPSILESEGKTLTICEGEQLTFKPSVTQAGDQFFWYDENGDLIVGNASDFTIPKNLVVGNHQFRLGTQRAGCTNQTSLSSIQVTVNAKPLEEDIIINSQGGVLDVDNKIIYPVGTNIILTPDNSQLPAGGLFEWYRNVQEDDLHGLETAGATFTVDQNGQLTISNTTAAVLEQDIFLGYETESGCRVIKELELLSFIILPSIVHTFNVRAKEGLVDLGWELSNEQQEGTVIIQRASSNLEFIELASFSIVSSDERIRMEFTDHHPQPGRNYYRLLINKVSGNPRFYSEVRMAEISEFEIPAFIVFPNPFTEYFSVKPTMDLKGPLVGSLLNTHGVALLSQNIDSLTKGEIIEFQNLGYLPAGVYILRLETPNGSKSYRLTKQNGH